MHLGLSGISALVLSVVLPATASAQAGDREGEEQSPLPVDLVIPPAPALSPEQQLATFVLPPDVHIELVAAEPLVHDPVAIAFDGDGRLWVAEMRAYMPNVDGQGEDEPNGTIAVLRDTDGDGRMDERTEFLSGLVLPRIVQPVADGVVVLAPPDLFFCRDTDGDGKGDERTLIATGLGGIHSPEHAINGFVPNLDNWYRCANWNLDYRFEGGAWTTRRSAGGGQWGLAQDDLGRLFYDTNSDPLRGDLFASHYAVRNPNHGRASGVNVRFAADMKVWPARINPGVNRGYQPATLRDDFKLNTFTGACGPVVFRGDALPAEYVGNAFVAEPCGNLVKRYRIEEDERGKLTARDAYAGREFLTSTDERFRPVNLANGPDGALYVVDMYRGLIQHRLFVTSFLRKQVVERELERPIGLGRIWRIRAGERRKPPAFSSASWTELAAELAHPNGWRRDTAQRVIVEEGAGDFDAYDVVRAMLRESESALGRMHALWTLEGLDELRIEHVLAALDDADARVQLAGVRASEPWLGSIDSVARGQLFVRLAKLGAGTDLRLRHQILLSLGAATDPAALALMAQLLALDTSTGELRGAALSSLFDRELVFLRLLLAIPEWKEKAKGRFSLLKACARAVTRAGRTDRVDELLTVVAEEELEWRAEALVAGVLDGRPKGPKGKKTHVRLASAPRAFDALKSVEATAALCDSIAWPGRKGFEEIEVRPLTPEERARFERGRKIYADICASCHQPSGQGEPGRAPSLRNSEWVLGSAPRLASLVTAGLQGPLKIGGETWNMDMPAYSDANENLAALFTYMRREWGHGADPVTLDDVTEGRAVTKARPRPWTAAELRAAFAGE